mgnify:CR=1 FL=1
MEAYEEKSYDTAYYNGSIIVKSKGGAESEEFLS